MLNKIHLFHKIQKFYKIFGMTNFIHRPSDMTSDNLFDVMYDINEVLDESKYIFNEETYEQDVWLNKLLGDIETMRECMTKRSNLLKCIILGAIIIYCAVCFFDLVAPMEANRGSWWNIFYQILTWII